MAKPAWHAMLPGRKSPAAYSLDELRAAKQAHAFLTESFAGPEAVTSCIRGFRYLLFFGIACVAEDRYPPLTRCWKDLEARFMGDPMFEDQVFVQSWILMDFPFGPSNETALDYFEEFLKGTEVAPQLQPFIDAGRKSRLGLHQDVMRTKKVAKFRELFTGNVASAIPSIERYGKGEILLCRMMSYGDQAFIFGDPKGFPAQTKSHIENMIQDKLFYLVEDGSLNEQYETFMRLAGPYWMSCVIKDEDAPILDPDHYLIYLTPPVR